MIVALCTTQPVVCLCQRQAGGKTSAQTVYKNHIKWHSHFLFPPFRERSSSRVWFGYNAFFHPVSVAAWNFAGEGKSLKNVAREDLLALSEICSRCLFFFMNEVIRERLVHLEKPRMSTIQTCQLCRCSSVMTSKSLIAVNSVCLSFHWASAA